MTSPGRYRNEPSDIIDTINQLTRRIEALERNPRVGNTAIDTGTLRVKDSTGSVRVQMGLLSDNTYGVEAKETGQDNFHQVPYAFAASVPTFEGTTSTTYTNLTTPGPSITVPIRSTGRVLISIATQIQWAGNTFSAGPITQGGYASVEVSGANTISPNTIDDKLLAMDYWIWQFTGAVTWSNTATKSPSSSTTLEGLTPGLTTFTMKYAQITGAANAAEFGRRCLTVIAL